MVSGAPGVVNATVPLCRGGKLSIINKDEGEHQAVPLSGPVKVPKLADMNRLGATNQATFAKAGVYRFKSAIGRDFVKGLKTHRRGLSDDHEGDRGATEARQGSPPACSGERTPSFLEGP
jgi:hypothetical protein